MREVALIALILLFLAPVALPQEREWKIQTPRDKRLFDEWIQLCCAVVADAGHDIDLVDEAARAVVRHPVAGGMVERVAGSPFADRDGRLGRQTLGQQMGKNRDSCTTVFCPCLCSLGFCECRRYSYSTAELIPATFYIVLCHFLHLPRHQNLSVFIAHPQS